MIPEGYKGRGVELSYYTQKDSLEHSKVEKAALQLCG